MENTFNNQLIWQKHSELTAMLNDNFENCKEKWFNKRLMGTAIIANNHIIKAFELPWKSGKIAYLSKAKEELVNLQSLLVLAENMKLCKVSKIRAMQEEAVALSKIIYGLLRHLRKPKADKEEAAAA
jgi:hypothetical protein